MHSSGNPAGEYFGAPRLGRIRENREIMKTLDQVTDWLNELKSERRDAVTKQMVLGNAGAMNALKWVLVTTPTEEELRLKINELQVTRNESFTDEMATVGYSAMIESLKWVLRTD